MSTQKLNPIYAALDSHQYSRAIKLCAALPDTHTLGKALLAHSYAKNGQRYLALKTFQRMLGVSCFPELQLEIKYCLVEPSTTSSANQAPVKKPAKKGKKKTNNTVPDVTENTPDDWDLIDRLETPPVLPDNWEQLPSSDEAPTDHTLLATMAMTLQAVLRMPLTSYQIYCWAVSKADGDQLLTKKAIAHGIAVTAAPQYIHLSSTVLANCQVLSLHLARVQQQYAMSEGTALAAQLALWQLPSADPRKQEMLPRLAESLAQKDTSTAETFHLYLRTLEIQGKHEVYLEKIQERLASGQEPMVPPRETLFDLQSKVLGRLHRYEDGLEIIEQELLRSYPDDWTFWKRHMDFSRSIDGSLERTMELALSISENPEQPTKYPLRGPHLVPVEIASQNIVQRLASLGELLEAIQKYADLFESKVSCVFSDLKPYLELFLSHAHEEQVKALLDYISANQCCPSSDDVSERHNELRKYIFSIQVSYLALASREDLRRSYMPDWKEMIVTWRDFQAFEQVDQAQKEPRPADDLVLLAVQQILMGVPTREDLLVSSILLESAISYSPYNAYLKILAIQVYSELDAVSKAWLLYQQIYTKHIQHESCSYIILPLLLRGGFYQEAITVCQNILHLQRTASRETNDYIRQALEQQTYSKVEEFVEFQRLRMNKSLTAMEAKGVVLDCAPMYRTDDNQGYIGAVLGIVGCPTDIERAKQMIAEAHNPAGAFSLLRLDEQDAMNVQDISDNRDLRIFSFQINSGIKFDSKEKIISDSMRRGYHHSLLIRTALCVEASKGPKKGKIVKASSELQRRCNRLLFTVERGEQRFEDILQPDAYCKLLAVMMEMCRIIVGISIGFPEKIGNDSLENREEIATSRLRKATGTLSTAKQTLALHKVSLDQICLLLSDCVVSLFAVFRMCATVMESYGWGKRKRMTKPSAGALAEMSMVLSSLIEEMKEPALIFPERFHLSDHVDSSFPPHVIDETMVNEAAKALAESQSETKIRVQMVLDEMQNSLKDFDGEDS